MDLSPEEKFRQEIFNTSSGDLPDLLDNLSNELIPNHEESLNNILICGIKNFKFEEKQDFNIENFQKLYYKGIHKIITLHHKFVEDGLMTNSEESNVYLIKFNKLFEIFHYWEQAIRSLNRVKIASNPHYDSSMNTDIGLSRFVKIDPETNTPYQNLVLYMLNCLSEEGIRKQGDKCMRRIYTDEGYDTHAWEPFCSINEYIYNKTQKDINRQQWCNLTVNPSNKKNLEKYLEEVEDPQFVNVIKDRHLFSFNNGIYETCFYNEETKKYEDRFYAYDPQDDEYSYLLLDSKRSACKYFDTDFVYHHYNDWYDIPTPYFQSILDHQKFSEEVCRWMYILFCGRVLYEVSEMDEWQIMPFLKGRAGTGKCLGKNTPIIMYDGSIKMVQDIKIGDKIMGDDSTPRNVLCTNTGVGQLYKIKQNQGDDYIVNGEHVLSLKISYVNKKNVYIENKPYKRGDIVDIPVKDYIKLSQSKKKMLKGYKTDVEFSEKKIPFDPYLLGLWLGDGDSDASNITNKDSSIIKYLKETLPKYNCYSQYGGKYRYRINTTEKSNYFWNNIENLGLRNNKHIPEIFKINSRENRLRLLAGILDTDGHYDIRGGVYDLIQKNKKLANDIVFLCNSLGFYTKIVKCEKNCKIKNGKFTGIYYRMCISGNNLEDIPCLIPRKQARFRERKTNVLYTGIKVEPIHVGNYYGFQLDGNHRFLMKDTTVTHNSTIITRVSKEFFHSIDVGTLSNNCEKKFGLSALKDKFLFIAPEIKGNIGLEQCDFQTIISGEDTSVAEKFKTAEAVRWKVPGLMAGNEPPGYTDNSGSISRRLCVFNFKKKVAKANTQLGKKLLEEIPALLLKGNKAYIQAVQEYGKKDIWDSSVLPKYFRKTKSEMAEQTNSLSHFLASGKVVFGPDKYCRQRDFIAVFNEHSRENNLPKHVWNEDYFGTLFEEKGIRINDKIKMLDKITKRNSSGTWILGIDLFSERGEEDDLE